MSFVRTHFCVVVAFGTAGGGTCGKAVGVSCLGVRGGGAATRLSQKDWLELQHARDGE
jgi:hypothetical protein